MTCISFFCETGVVVDFVTGPFLSTRQEEGV